MPLLDKHSAFPDIATLQDLKKYRWPNYPSSESFETSMRRVIGNVKGRSATTNQNQSSLFLPSQPFQHHDTITVTCLVPSFFSLYPIPLWSSMTATSLSSFFYWRAFFLFGCSGYLFNSRVHDDIHLKQVMYCVLFDPEEKTYARLGGIGVGWTCNLESSGLAISLAARSSLLFFFAG